jgi:hypothetical protein
MNTIFTKASAMAVLLTGFALSAEAQTVSNFENLPLPSAESYWDGSDQSGSFQSGNAEFFNFHDGSYWLGGFAYSNMTDITTAGFMNLYSAIPGIGANSSTNYAVGQDGATLRITGPAKGGVVDGFHVTNSTFAALSMQDGDMFAKKFGGATGDDPDWFLLTIVGYLENNPKDTIRYYLADYRYADNSFDYIVKEWRWVDTRALGNIDSMSFHLSSSDLGQWGMNTPAFFCMDYFTTGDYFVSVKSSVPSIAVKAYPNPARNFINLESSAAFESVEIIDITGRPVTKIATNGENKLHLDVSSLSAGIYHIRYQTGSEAGVKTILKQ